jgi:anti-sigma factor RsiW
MREVDAPSCGHENDLVSSLYGELSDSEKKLFESHMHTCRLCQVQTAEFNSIRESVGAWRDESLGRAAVTVSETSRLANQPRNSALAALRAFFDLSPFWMKSALGFAAILFCIFTVLAVARLRNAPEVTATNASSQAYSQQDLNAMVEKRVQDEIARRKVAEKQATASSPASVAVKDKTARPRSRGLLNQSNEVAANARYGKARRPLSKSEREQLAADLRLVSSKNERGLDLVDDQINQQ